MQVLAQLEIEMSRVCVKFKIRSVLQNFEPVLLINIARFKINDLICL